MGFGLFDWGLYIHLIFIKKPKHVFINELACVYAALILTDDQVAVTTEKLLTILKTANVSVKPYWPTLFPHALEGVDMKSLLTSW